MKCVLLVSGILGISLHAFSGTKATGGLANSTSQLCYKSNSVGMVFCDIPGGHFMMGAPADEEGFRERKGPQHYVTISKDFEMMPRALKLRMTSWQ